jgi:hypothetical protein
VENIEETVWEKFILLALASSYLYLNVNIGGFTENKAIYSSLLNKFVLMQKGSVAR